MSEIRIERAGVDGVRAMLRRREADEATMRIALALADRGGAWTAREDSEIVGLALANVAEEECHVGDLYVEPSYRGQGIAGRLLDEVFSQADERVRSMTLPAGDAASLALASRRGLIPREVVLRFAGAIPGAERLAMMAAGDYRFTVEPLDLAIHRFALDALDRETRGAARSEDHREFGRDACGYAFALEHEFVAYVYLWPDGRIGPLASASGAYLAQLFAYALVALRRLYGASWCSAIVPASNLHVVRSALRAGLRIAQTFTLASDGASPGASRCIGFHHLVF